MNILIAYDGSTFADAAIDDLRMAGLPPSTSATVVTVAEVFLPPDSDDAEPLFPATLPIAVQRARADAENVVREARKLAEHGARILRDRFPSWTVTAEARADSAGWGIVARADELGVDLVVVGSHGRNALERFVLGSVSQKVVAEAHCSVRVARPRRSRAIGSVRLLVATDGSSHATIAARSLLTRAWPHGSQVRVISVIDSTMASAVVPHRSPIDEWRRPDDVEGSAWVYRMVESTSKMLADGGLEVSSLVVEGSPKEKIVEEADAWDADTIVIGSTGLRGIDRLLLGSISSAVTARAHCSVEVVRSARAV